MKQIKIMGHFYDLILEEGYRTNRQTNIDGNWATIDNISRKITVDTSIGGFFESILHECIHALDWKLTLGLDEFKVQRLSEGLFGLLIDNGWLIPNIEEDLIDKDEVSTNLVIPSKIK